MVFPVKNKNDTDRSSTPDHPESVVRVLLVVQNNWR